MSLEIGAWNSQAPKLNPIRASVLLPARNSGVPIMCSNGPWWLSWISSLGSQPVAWRIPREAAPAGCVVVGQNLLDGIAPQQVGMADDPRNRGPC